MPQPGKGHIRVPTWKFPGGRVVERELAQQGAAGRPAREVPRADARRRQRNRRALAKLQTKRADLETLAQLHRALPRLRADRDHLRRHATRAPCTRRSRPKLQADRGFDITADRLAATTCRRCTSRRSPRLTRAFSQASRSRPVEAQAAAATCRSGRMSWPSSTWRARSSTPTSCSSTSGCARRASGRPPGRARSLNILANLPRYLRAERRDRGEFIRIFLRRYEGMPVARLEKIVDRGYGDTMWRHTSVAAVEAHPRASRRRAPHRAGHAARSRRLAKPIADLFDEVVAGADAREGRRAHRLPRDVPRSSTRREPPGCASTPRSTASTSPGRTATATATPTWCGSNCSATRTP